MANEEIVTIFKEANLNLKKKPDVSTETRYYILSRGEYDRGEVVILDSYIRLTCYYEPLDGPDFDKLREKLKETFPNKNVIYEALG